MGCHGRRGRTEAPWGVEGGAGPARDLAVESLDARIQEYANRKGIDWKTAHDYLVTFALGVIEGRRRGGRKVGNRPEQKTHLVKARARNVKKNQ